ncbi:MAG: hypothetical protein QXP70_06320 [Methanomassiliicoccales archaeon]
MIFLRRRIEGNSAWLGILREIIRRERVTLILEGGAVFSARRIVDACGGDIDGPYFCGDGYKLEGFEGLKQISSEELAHIIASGQSIISF